MYIALNRMVGQASRTILRQQGELEHNIEQLQGLLDQNKGLHERVSRAAARTTTLNEQFLRRVSSDLHDGPAQDVSLALLRLDSLAALLPSADRGEMESMRGALQSAMEEIRSISAGLRLPEIGQISAEETVRRAVRDYQRKSNSDVKIKVDQMPEDVPLSVRITLYRIVQEGLSNSYRHAGGKGQAVTLQGKGSSLSISVSDSGAGFNAEQIGSQGHLGLIGMRERVEMLGGAFQIQSGEEGTTISAQLPLAAPGLPAAE
jgi:signal transduction histidine kinase